MAMAKRRDERPLLWSGLRGKDNVVVLDDSAVYVARLPLKELPRVNLAFDTGEEPAAVLAKCRKVRLDRITAFEYDLSPLTPLAVLTLIDRRRESRRLTTLTFPTTAERDKFKVELQARLGGWRSTERLQHPALIALKYVPPLVGLVLVTIVVTVAQWKGGHGLLGTLFSAAGIAVGVIVGGMGIRELRHPMMTVTFAPDASLETDAEGPDDAEGDGGPGGDHD